MSDDSSYNYSQCTFISKSTDCGINDDLFMSVLIGDFQETAEKGADDCGWGTDFIKSHNFCWIIMKSKVNVIRLPKWKEQFTIRTWHTGLDKISFNREYEVLDLEGNIIVSATSSWILCETDSHRPVIPKRIEGFPSVEPQLNRLAIGEYSPKLKFPSIEEVNSIDPVIVKYADFSELDRNHHVNNSRYIAWVYDAMYKEGIDANSVKSLSINYVSEVKPGEKVLIFLINNGKEIEVYGYKNIDDKVFVVRVLLF